MTDKYYDDDDLFIFLFFPVIDAWFCFSICSYNPRINLIILVVLKPMFCENACFYKPLTTCSILFLFILFLRLLYTFYMKVKQVRSGQQRSSKKDINPTCRKHVQSPWHVSILKLVENSPSKYGRGPYSGHS